MLCQKIPDLKEKIIGLKPWCELPKKNVRSFKGLENECGKIVKFFVAIKCFGKFKLTLNL